MRNTIAMKKFEKRFLAGVAVAWAAMLLFTYTLKSAETNENIVVLTVYETNVVRVKVPLKYEDLVRKYLLLARGYEENRINAHVLSEQNSRLMLTVASNLVKLKEIAGLKDAPKNLVSIGNIVAPNFGFEISYLRNIWGPLWAYGRIQTPVGASAGLGIAF